LLVFWYKQDNDIAEANRFLVTRKQIPTEALINLRRRLEMLPPRCPERRRLVEETAVLYGVSNDTLYRALRERV